MIPALGVSLLALGALGLALRRTGVAAATEHIVTSTVTGLTAMLDGELSDDAKEVAVRRAGLGLVAASLGLLWRAAVAVAAAAVPVLLADVVGLASAGDVVALLSRWDFIVVVSVAAVLLAAVLRRRRAGDGATDRRYSTADRLFHSLAFASPGVLRTAARVEDRVLPDRGPPVRSTQPILVTSLARAGTTALLNALADVPGVATHTYRDMPFVTAPDLWNRVAGGRLRRVERRERAHGDGLEIDLDSPEAFEEVVWRMFWPEKYGTSTIGTWTAQDRRADAERFLTDHMHRIVRTRVAQGTVEPDATGGLRYCSKNNTSIARIPFLLEAFPDCHVVVPVRRPESHAASSLRQHRNFLDLQSDDEFVQRYMTDIGHFEFGLTHRPIAFPGFDPARHDPATHDYWLDYWVHAFREVLRHADACLVVPQDDLRSSPHQAMTRLCDALGLPTDGLDLGGHFRSEPDEAPTDVYDPGMLAEAVELYEQLGSLAVTRPGARP